MNSRSGLKLLTLSATLLAACHGDRPTMTGSATHLAFLDNVSASTVSLQPLSSIRVAFMTADDQIAANQSGTISLHLITSDSTAHLTGVVDAVASGGIATFADLRVDRAGAGYSLFARSDAFDDVASSLFSITVGKPSKLRFALRPNSVVAGDTMTVAVGFADAGGNPVNDTNAVITLASVSASQDSVLGASTVATVNGVATFTGVSVHKATPQALIATAPSFGAAQSVPIFVWSGTLTGWRFDAQPTAGIAGITLPSTVVRCVDKYGNPPSVPGAYLVTQVTLTFGDNPGGAILTGTTTQVGLGFVDFKDLKIDKPGVGYSLALTPVSGFCGQFPGATSSTFNVSP